MSWKDHKQRYKNCKLCKLKEGRRQVVLARGTIPCDILIIGEAPGVSEDMLGKPFIGPAGKLLDAILLQALQGETTLSCNLVGCIPRDEDGNKATAPEQEHIKTCRNRLVNLIKLAKPSYVLYAGRLAAKHGPFAVKRAGYKKVPSLDIVHPAAILRADNSQKGLLLQRTTISIQDFLYPLF